MIVVIVILSSLVGPQLHEIQVIRTTLNVERKDISLLLQGGLWTALFIACYLLIAYTIQNRKRRLN